MRFAHSPQKIYGHNDRPASQRNDEREFSEDADGIVASVPQQLMRIQQYSRVLRLHTIGWCENNPLPCSYAGHHTVPLPTSP
jgi:hypothetical protein